ncbi:hypothetical protein [Butyrivibrio sp. AE3009]|uniref:hypothetical protein n=1 Tax=Butyrivibrio sp. AE3009 TaxID=1280666 RepID=UPI0003B59215|nr:hypothetical protein [Butyrivibrio sp. AE3009]
MSKKRNTEKESFLSEIPVWVHISVLAVIVVVIVFSLYKLIKWNSGTVETEGQTGVDAEVEVLDQIFVLPEEKKAGHEDDGTETILFLGNDAITYDQGETGVVEQIGSKLGATVYNCGFPDTTVALKYAERQDNYPADIYSFKNVIDCIVDGNLDMLVDSASNYTDYTYEDHARKLRDVDFDKVDTLVIFYDASDYLKLRVGMNPDNDQDPITYSGALNYGIKRFQEKYPHIRIVCMSFTMCYAYDSTGALVSGDRYDFGNGKLTTYLQFMIDNSGATGVSFIDNYYGTVHEDNSSGWLLDNIHTNAACNEHIASHFVSAIYNRD